MNELTVINTQLPDTLEDLSKFVLIGRDKLQAVRAEISAMEKLGLANEVVEQKKKEQIEITETVTLAEVRAGELMKQIPKASGARTDLQPIDSSVERLKPKSEVIKELGFSPKQAERMQQMADNKPIVMQALQKARDKDDVASRAFILGEIKKEKRKEAIQKQVEDIENNVMERPDGLFDVISIDPPWNYGTQFNASGRRVANPYPEMSQEELKNIEIPAAENCVMFLWTTHKFIWDAKELLDAWGFEYRSMLVWDKEKIGMGDLIRMQCEFCIVGIKGKPVFKDNHSIRDIIKEPRREHSRKPEAFYQLVNDLCTGRKLDYFSRSKRDGWCSYGNDTEKF